MEELPTVVIDTSDVTLLRRVNTPTQPCLLLYSGPDAGLRFDLEPGSQVIGRQHDAQVRVDDSGVSRQHAELSVVNGSVVLHDLGSANGTLVNEVPVRAPVALKDGDLVRVGKALLRFHTRNNLDLLLRDRIYQRATQDPGTGAFNRRFLHDHLRQAFARARHGGRPLSLVAYDLDHFKRVNDSYGHAGGDIVLRVTTTIARAELRDGDVLARIGGEEFVIVLEDTPAAAAVEVAERVRAAMAEFPIELPDPVDKANPRALHHVQTVSLGVAALKADMADEQALLQAADEALYCAKRRGRDQVAL